MTEAWGLTIGASVLAGVWIGAWAIPLVFSAVLILQLIRGRFGIRALTVAMIAVVIGMYRGDAVPQSFAPPDLHLSEGASGQVIGVPKASAGGVQVSIHISTVTYRDGSSVSSSFSALTKLPDGADVDSGDRVDLVWAIDPLDRLPPGYARYVASQGATASGIAWSVTVVQNGASFMDFLGEVRERLTARLRSIIPGDAGSLAAGVVTGDDASLTETARNAFLRTGTSHITAVSGSNVAMLLALWNMIIFSSRTRRSFIVQVAIVISIWAYALLVGLEPSAVRAAIVASLGMFSGRFGRRAEPLTILLLTMGGMVLVNPDYTRMIGFWLSVVASFAFISRMPVGSGPLSKRLMITRVAQGVLLAQAATLPLVLLTFGTWSFSSILANLLISPAMTLAFPLTFLLALVVLTVPTLAPVLAWIPALLLDFVLAVVTRLSPMVSPFHVEPASLTALIGIGIPCALIMIAASADAARWKHIIGRRWTFSPRMIATIALISMTGIAFGVLITLVT